MPKRTNKFQKLIYLIKEQVAEESKVIESKMLPDLITGTKREVDICIESSVGGHDVNVCIECRDRKRTADVTWIEEMKSKHERLSTNALVLISSSGFSKEAKKVAKISNIELLTFEEANQESIEKLFGNLKELFSKIFSLSPTKVLIDIAQTGDLSSETVVAFPDTAAYRSNNKFYGTLNEIVESLLNSQMVVEEFIKIGEEIHKGFLIKWEAPPYEHEDSLYLQKLEPLVLRKIDFIRIYGKFRFEINKFSLNHSKLGNIRVSWGEGEFSGKPLILVATEDKYGKKKIKVTTE